MAWGRRLNDWATEALPLSSSPSLSFSSSPPSPHHHHKHHHHHHHHRGGSRIVEGGWPMAKPEPSRGPGAWGVASHPIHLPPLNPPLHHYRSHLLLLLAVITIITVITTIIVLIITSSSSSSLSSQSSQSSPPSSFSSSPISWYHDESSWYHGSNYCINNAFSLIQMLLHGLFILLFINKWVVRIYYFQAHLEFALGKV